MNKFWHYLGETAIVFIGVFSAFWLNDFRETRLQKERQTEVYQTIYEGLDRFYNAGKADNEKGFIQFFEDIKSKLDSAIENKKISPNFIIYGDYWNIEVITTLIESGIISEVDLDTFKKISRFHTVHGNFLKTLDYFNNYYATNVTNNYINGHEEFFTNGQLRERYVALRDYPQGLVEFSSLLVKLSYELKEDIKEKHLQSK